jgi:hypothetical protein
MRLLKKLEKLLKKKFELDSQIARLQFKLGEMAVKEGRPPLWKTIL